MQSLVEYLNSRITRESSLSDIVDVFEAMCQIPIADDDILFEVGTFDFTGSAQFYFSLVRQLPSEDEEDDEFCQIHVDVLYTPTAKNAQYSGNIWNTEVEGNIFERIRKSKVFFDIKDDEIASVEIYMEET